MCRRWSYDYRSKDGAPILAIVHFSIYYPQLILGVSPFFIMFPAKAIAVHTSRVLTIGTPLSYCCPFPTTFAHAPSISYPRTSSNGS